MVQVDRKSQSDVVFLLWCSEGTVSAVVKPHITDVAVDTCYSCQSNELLVDSLANQTLWNVLVQAFVNNGSKSETRE